MYEHTYVTPLRRTAEGLLSMEGVPAGPCLDAVNEAIKTRSAFSLSLSSSLSRSLVLSLSLSVSPL